VISCGKDGENFHEVSDHVFSIFTGEVQIDKSGLEFFEKSFKKVESKS
jgi:hypothetical protein